MLIPVARPRQGWSFHEMVRRTSDFAIVAVAVMVDLNERTGAIAAAHVALAGVADRVVLADPELTGATADEDLDAAAARIAERLEPPDDVHASGEYRQPPGPGAHRPRAPPGLRPGGRSRPMSEPRKLCRGSGVAWTEERGTSDEGRRRSVEAWGRRAGPRRRTGEQ